MKMLATDEEERERERERDMKNACNILVGKFESRRQFWIPRHK
jgi:hypothetical protein